MRRLRSPFFATRSISRIVSSGSVMLMRRCTVTGPPDRRADDTHRGCVCQRNALRADLGLRLRRALDGLQDRLGEVETAPSPAPDFLPETLPLEECPRPASGPIRRPEDLRCARDRNVGIPRPPV